jgi:hypothetical protein
MTPKLLIFLFFPLYLFAQNNPSPFIGTNIARGNNLRVLRLAVSCTGEFTQSVSGANDAEKVNEVLIQMKNWVKEINLMYGREYCVRFELIPDNLLRNLIFTNPATDPWLDMSGGAGCTNSGNILNIQASTIDGIVGVANYDISHVILFNFNGGCAGSFKLGYSGGFDIGITRHEIGHQFSQSHTINNGGANNYEPENTGGRTIQGGNVFPYAHANSYHQLALLLNNNTTSGYNILTGNNIPNVNAGLNRSIPISTPFTLIGTATDIDSGDYLTYVWDQLDGGIAQNLPTTNDTQGALFSRLLPQNSNNRTFPQMSSIIANDFSNSEEDLPTQARDLNFRLTVNDNHKFNYNGTLVNASGINSDDIKISVVNNGGAFQVTSQSTTVTYIGGSNQTITWNVAGTNLSPINTTNVKISLSTDGGNTFPFVLIANTINDGTESVTMPNFNTSLARIKIEAVANYFFAINSQNFTIIQNTNIGGINVLITGSNTLVSEYGRTDTYSINLLKTPLNAVTVLITADNQTEISLNGVSFRNNISISLISTSPIVITVRGKYDNLEEGGHLGVIQHIISASSDIINYPVGMIGQNVIANVSDAQLQAIIGIDFDDSNSTESPTNWIKISDIRNQTFSNLIYEDGTPSTINLTTNATNCGIGGCGFPYGTIIEPVHFQSLSKLKGLTYATGTASFTWSGLEVNTQYHIFIFGLGVFGPINQNISITGNSTPISFVQNASTNVLYINDRPATNDYLDNFAKVVTSSSTGTIIINTSSNLTNTEMAFAGIGIRKVRCPSNNITLNSNPFSSGVNQTSQKLQATGTVQAGTNVTLLSGKAIELTGLFNVQRGSVFEAKIGGCL